jgi:hypothetical protein
LIEMGSTEFLGLRECQASQGWPVVAFSNFNVLRSHRLTS